MVTAHAKATGPGGWLDVERGGSSRREVGARSEGSASHLDVILGHQHKAGGDVILYMNQKRHSPPLVVSVKQEMLLSSL